MVRPLKREKPKGWEDFAIFLKDVKVPTSCIGNPINLEYIKRLYLTESKTSPASIDTRDSSFKVKEASTPISTKPDKVSKTKIDWERWTPY